MQGKHSNDASFEIFISQAKSQLSTQLKDHNEHLYVQSLQSRYDQQVIVPQKEIAVSTSVDNSTEVYDIIADEFVKKKVKNNLQSDQQLNTFQSLETQILEP